jgi:hypothetical protein
MARGNLGGKSACSNTKITASVDDITLLWSLMRTLPFADSFIGYAEDLGDDGIVVHGPYELIKLSTSDFRPESSAHLLSKISAFLSECTPPLTPTDLQLDSILEHILAGEPTVYQLLANESAEYWVVALILCEFAESIVINRLQQQLYCVVVGAD